VKSESVAQLDGLWCIRRRSIPFHYLYRSRVVPSIVVVYCRLGDNNVRAFSRVGSKACVLQVKFAFLRWVV
jgi:hypothetical protein